MDNKLEILTTEGALHELLKRETAENERHSLEKLEIWAAREALSARLISLKKDALE